MQTPTRNVNRTSTGCPTSVMPGDWPEDVFGASYIIVPGSAGTYVTAFSYADASWPQWVNAPVPAAFRSEGDPRK